MLACARQSAPRTATSEKSRGPLAMKRSAVPLRASAFLSTASLPGSRRTTTLLVDWGRGRQRSQDRRHPQAVGPRRLDRARDAAGRLPTAEPNDLARQADGHRMSAEAGKDRAVLDRPTSSARSSDPSGGASTGDRGDRGGGQRAWRPGIGTDDRRDARGVLVSRTVRGVARRARERGAASEHRSGALVAGRRVTDGDRIRPTGGLALVGTTLWRIGVWGRERRSGGDHRAAADLRVP